MATDTTIAMTAIHSLRSITELYSIYAERRNHTSLKVELCRDISHFFIRILKPKRNRRFEDIGVYIF